MVDIAQIGHEDDFELHTNELGVLICWYPNSDKLKEVLEGHPTNSVGEQTEFLRAVLLVTAHRPHAGKPWQANPIASEDVERVTARELGTFALKQAKRIYVRMKQPHEHTDNPYLSLASALILDRELRQASFEKVRKQFGHAFTKDSTIGAILKNIEASSALGATLDSIKNKNIFSEPHRTIDLTPPPTYLGDPMRETNAKLDKFLEGIQEIKPVVNQTAEMLQSLNDAAREMQNDYIKSSLKAERQAKLAIWFAGVGIFISAIGLGSSTFFSYRTMKDSEMMALNSAESSENLRNEAEKAIGLLQLDLQAIKSAVENSKKDDPESRTIKD